MTKANDDEIWTTRNGQTIAVCDMTEHHVRNALRLLLRTARQARERRLRAEGNWVLESEDWPDNHQTIASLRLRYGESLQITPENIGGMDGANVYVNGEWIAWLGGIS